ncbi:hypothetical protein WICMUC_002523 [Wickerhamomyces mucosus]|uniref:Uncharacterized protein n=1 Tax=Wickerhamomyces mucosus TaxID=1378264 RepID=A0A9P8PPA9_9ASCO|nr:hypothetical protein WICMUC_002523 [Wickerhamomyces mucosus]
MSEARKLIDTLLSQTFSNHTSLPLDSNNLLALNFLLPKTFPKALELLDLKKIYLLVKFQQFKSEQNNFENDIDNLMVENNEFIIFGANFGDPIILIDLSSWFCTCSDFNVEFNTCEVINSKDILEQCHNNIVDIQYGSRDKNLPQFKDEIPICEHLLSCYLISLDHINMYERSKYQIKYVDQSEYCYIMSKII